MIDDDRLDQDLTHLADALSGLLSPRVTVVEAQAQIRDLRRQVAAHEYLHRKAMELVTDRDKVIARLLDGWEPVVGRHAFDAWVDPNCVREGEPMSDAEVEIIRAHENKGNDQ